MKTGKEAVAEGSKGITAHANGGISIVGPDAINLARLLMIKSGMEFEARTGMRLTKAVPSCFTIARREFGLKGNKQKLYQQFCEMHGFDMRPDVFPAKT